MLPTRSPCSEAKPSLTSAPSSPRSVSPVDDVEPECRDRRDRRALTPCWLPKASAPSWRSELTCARARRRPARPSGSIGDQPSEAVTIVWRLHHVGELAAALVLEALGDDRHRGHERDADHQRRGRDRGAARVAHRVVAREAAGRAAETRGGAADDARHGAHAAGEQAHLDRAARVAQRGDGRDLRRAAGRDRGGEHRRERADERARRRSCAVASVEPLGGQVHAERGEDRVQAGGEPDADADPGGGREQPDRAAPRAARRRAPGGGVAPTIRSSPNSFVRCATVIESELKIVNAPTSTATPAKASRIVRRMLTNSLERVEGEAVVVGRAADLRARHGRAQRAAQIGALLAPTRMRS